MEPRRIELAWSGPPSLDRYALNCPTAEYCAGAGWGGITLGEAVIAIDPGQTCGWAALSGQRITMGECPLEDLADTITRGPITVIVEQPPHGVVRAFEPAVYYAFGVLKWLCPWLVPQQVSALKPARTWVRVKSRGVSPHARDGLAHLAYFLALEDGTRLR